MTSQQQKPAGLPNPYAGGGLPNPYALPTSAAGAPTKLSDEQVKAEEKKTAANLFYNPHAVKRPQAKSAVNAKKPAVVAARPMMPSSSSDHVPVDFVQQHSIDYYKNTIDDDVAINEARREAERAKKQHKKETQKFQSKYGNWKSTDPYKLRKNTNVAAFKAAHQDGGGGYGYQNMMHEFRNYLRAERSKAIHSRDNSHNPNESRPTSRSRSCSGPASGTPPVQDVETETRPASPPMAHTVAAETGEDAYLRRLRLQQHTAQVAPLESAGLPPVVSPPEQAPKIPPFPVPASVPDTKSPPASVPETRPPPISESEIQPLPVQAAVAPPKVVPPVDDQVKQRLEKVKQQIEAAKERARQAAAALQPPPPPPPPAVPEGEIAGSSSSPTPPPPPAPYSATISAPPVRYSPTISAPPMRYSPTISGAPVHFSTSSTNEGEKKDTTKPAGGRPTKKQKTEEPPKPTKAELMMAKMGYVKGKGLGKNEDGVTTHLEVKARKDEAGKGARQRMDPDEMEWSNDGSGKRVQNKSQTIFDITGGLRTQPQEKSQWGEPSRVVVTWGCVDGIDFSTDADRHDGGIRQEMGDVFNTKFGPVERIHVNMSSAPKTVYILFSDMMAALNAVNRFSEGYRFQGRPVRAQFYEQARFDQYDFEH